MKNKILTIAAALILSYALTACGGTGDSDTNVGVGTDTSTVEETTATPTQAETTHEHAYAEEITTPATCEADGVKTFTCECGDTYTEIITTTGHIFEAYASNNDATYLADGTETSKCSNCDVTDTRTAEGSMLTYTYTDMNVTMYAQNAVNVRNLPSADGEKLGGLSQNEEVHVTGQCAETNWYRIEYSGGVAYVSNSYLGTDKVVVQVEGPVAGDNGSNTETEGYSIVMRNGHRYINKVVADYNEAKVAFAAVGYPAWQIIDEGNALITYLNAYRGDPDGSFMADHRAFSKKYLGEGGMSDWVVVMGLTTEKDDRIFVESVDGYLWSIEVYQMR